MSQLEFIDSILIRTLAESKNNLSGRVLRFEIFSRWKEIAGSLSSQITPLRIKNKTLYLCANNPAVKDTMKFLAKDIVEKINSTVGRGEKIIEKISFGKTFEKPDENLDEIINPKFEKKSPQKNLSEIILSAEEIAACEKNLSDIANETRRKELLETFLNRAKLNKWRLQNDWHKCKFCDSLCAPKEILCDSCKIREVDKMRKKIRRIFYDLPWTLFPDVQKQICKEMPHIKHECTLSVIESVWSALVCETAARVSYGDKNSLDAKFLVMLFKHVDEKKLTDKLIARALKELRFNLADQPPIKLKKNSTLQKFYAR